ncbi:MAG: hypothetical protein KatS3mg027_2435 [Bacteroidia bacterium]|nr:MAG: hypothetical protein KatS3mg027_2435 [Bacteroidia bacterium]
MDSWQKINYDPKLKVFLKELQNQFLNKKINKEGKLVIFTESKESSDYLKDQLEKIGRKDILTVSSDNRNQLHETIVEKF